MPTNLPPDYFAAERKFHEAESITAKIACLEEMFATIPKHKGTDHLRADLRRKISKLKTEQHRKKGTGRHESEYHIEREGCGRVALVGPTNTGKSSLLAAYTHALPKISDSPFTTWTPTPGMMTFENVHIQLIDTPPLNQEITKPELFDLIRTSDLILLILDLQAFPIPQFQDSIALLGKHKILSNHLRDRTAEPEQKNFLPFVIVVNKDDDPHYDDDFEVLCELLGQDWPFISTSVKTHRHLDELRKICYAKLDLIRIYAKPPGHETDRGQPFVLKRGSTIEDFAAKVHKDFLTNLKTARVWGSGVYDGQPVAKDHILEDGDIVELHI